MFKKINPATLMTPVKAFSNGILVPLGTANLLYVSGQMAQDRDGSAVHPDDAGEQTRYIFSHIAAILADAGMTLADVAKVQIFVVDMKENMAAISRARDEVFRETRPASTMVEVKGLVRPECRVEIEVTAIRNL